MSENKMKKVAELLGVEMGKPFIIKNQDGKELFYNPYRLCDIGVVDKSNVLKAQTLTFLLNGRFEICKPILDDVEKQYLEGVLSPFKNRIRYIKKHEDSGMQLIYIDFKDDYLSLPYFKKGTMYKGMEVDKRYTPKELGLFE